MPDNLINRILKSNVTRMVAALAAVGMLSATLLVFVYIYTKGKIEKNRNDDNVKAVLKIFPDAYHAAVYKQAQDLHSSPVAVTDKDNKLLGYAFTAEGNGYQGTIAMIAGVNADLTKLVGIEIVESQETPGLGAEIAGDKFKDQFNGLSVTHPIEYVKNKKPEQPYEIEAITGATISSRAVVNTLNTRLEEIRQLLGKK